MRTVTTELVREFQRQAAKAKIFVTRGRWHEGSELYGYWPEGDSYVFRVDGHYLCVSRGFIEGIANGAVTSCD